MAKPDPAHLDPAHYPHSVEVPTRYADCDPNNHINNVALAAIIEDARVRFHIASGFARALPPGGQVMIVNLNIAYLAQCYYPAPIMAYSGVVGAGGRSLTLRHLLVQNGQAAALAEAVVVYVQDGKASPLPESLGEVLARWSCT